MSAPSRRQAALLARAKQRCQVQQYIEGLIQRATDRMIRQIEQHLKEVAER